MLEMYRRDQFKQDLLIEQCLEVISIEERLREIDGLLEANAEARRQGVGVRCTCGAPIQWGSHFCANCGRPVGEEPVVACPNCGTALPPTRSSAPTAARRSPRARDRATGSRARASRRCTSSRRSVRAIPGRANSWASPRAARRATAATAAVGAEGGECPRCGTPYEPFQEYCLECGLRLPVSRGLIPVLSTAWRRRVPGTRATGSGPSSACLIVAALAAAIAILATTDNVGDETTAGTGPPVPANDGRARRPPGTDTSTTADDRRRRRRADDDRGASAAAASARAGADRVAPGPERLDDRARVDPAELGPGGRQRVRAAKALAAGLTDVGVLNSGRVLEPPPGLLRGLQRDLQLGERGESSARHGEGELSAGVRAPDRPVTVPGHGALDAKVGRRD